MRVLTYNQKHQLISEGDRLLVACSGGADSIALLTFLHQQKDYLAIEIGCIHANHGLRGEESDEDERFVKHLCRKLEHSVSTLKPYIQEHSATRKWELARCLSS